MDVYLSFQRGRCDFGAASSPALAVKVFTAVDNAADFTARERDVLEKLVLGLTDRNIASRLGISEKTGGLLMSSICPRFGAHDCAEAAAIALKRGVVDLPAKPLPK
jgi:DNA-binding NarL/FixJ family response regulator